MSWLSKATGIHIGSGPKPIPSPPPGTLSPEAQRAFDSMNATINRGHSINTGTMIGAGAALAPIALGSLGGAGAATGAAAGAAAPATGGGLSLASILGAIKKGGSAVGSFLGDHGNLVDAGLGTAAALNAANLSKQSTGYAKNAMDTANQSYDSRAPLRLAGVQGMLKPVPSSNVLGASQNSGNPFSRKPIPLSQVG